ncbi:hypothetical protein ES703_84339 [subsurface metagenome]
MRWLKIHPESKVFVCGFAAVHPRSDPAAIFAGDNLLYLCEKISGGR